MLTRRGWGLVAGSVGFALAGRLFGILELYVLAGAGLALCAIAFVYVWSRRVDLDTTRSIHPPRVHAGGSSRVELDVRNTGKRRSPVARVRDPFEHGWRWARFLVPPLAPGARAQAAYRLPTEERGVYDIGPLEVGLGDPFGLAATSFQAAPVTQLTVYPRVDQIRAVPASQGQDPHSGADRPTVLLGTGEDFYALRAYELGDDTRRVHWPSTARLDELMIRQDEMPWQTRVTILLDVRAAVHTPESLELAVSAAASVHEACRRTGGLVRLVATDGADSGFSAGQAHAEAILEHLATVEATGDDRLAGAVASLRRAGNGGSLVVVTTALAAPADLDALARLRGRYGGLALVVFERSSWEPSAVTARVPPVPLPAVGTVVRVTAAEPFRLAWDRALAGAAAGAGAGRG